MKSFAFLFVCLQACLLQSVYSQCVGAGWNGYGYGLAEPYPAAYGYGPGYPGPVAPCGIAEAYGGAGVGEVVVAGELPVAGATLVAGQVPILGAVEFGGVLPAAGAVTITGSCACGCGGYGPGPGPYYY